MNHAKLNQRPEYALIKGLGVWQLIFEGRHTILKHEKGILYVSWLLINHPAEPIHALDLLQKLSRLHANPDPETRPASPLIDRARIHERSLALDDIDTLRALWRKQKELETILDDDSESEPVKSEALAELQQIADFLKHHGRRTEDNAQKAVRAVRRAITRFHQRLLNSCDTTGNPHPILTPFAAHLEKHLLIPSSRYSRRLRCRASGRFTYDPPPGIIWFSTL